MQIRNGKGQFGDCTESYIQRRQKRVKHIIHWRKYESRGFDTEQIIAKLEKTIYRKIIA